MCASMSCLGVHADVDVDVDLDVDSDVDVNADVGVDLMGSMLTAEKLTSMAMATTTAPWMATSKFEVNISLKNRVLLEATLDHS